MIKYSTHVTSTSKSQKSSRGEEWHKTAPHSNITMIFVVLLFAIPIPIGTAEKIRVINFNGKQSTTTENLRYPKDDGEVTATRETTFCFRFMLRYSRGMLLIKTNQVQFTIMDQVWPIVKCFLFASPKNLGGQGNSMTLNMGGHSSLLTR